MPSYRRYSPVHWLLTGGLIAVFILSLFTNVNTSPVSAAPEPEVEAQTPFTAATLPTISLNVPATVMVGEDVSFTVTFDNPDASPDTGYGPFIDLIIDTTGADGIYPGVPAANAYDGLGQTTITASYLGIAITGDDFVEQQFDNTGVLTHPWVRDSSGAYVTVNGTPGDKLVSIRLPFGSFTPLQPAATVSVTVDMSNLADVGTPLTVQARGGYEFGYTPLNDWCCGDAAWPGAVTGWTSDSVTPSLFTLSKAYSGPEDETATGPNFPRDYTITVDIADGQTLTSLNVVDTLPNNMQYIGLVGTTPAYNSVTEPSTSTPGGTLTVVFNSVTGGATASDVEVTFSFYIPRDDTTPARVIDPVTGDDVLSCNNASVSASWTPVDTRDTGGSQAINPGGCEHTLTDKSIAIQKGVSVVGGGGVKPGAVLEYSLDFQVSDFFVFDSLVLDDLISDGQHVLSTFTPTLEVNGNGFTLASSAIDGANFDVTCNYTGGPGAECDGDNPAANDGTTSLVVRVSDELILRATELAPGAARDHVAAGRLLGGCVPLGGSASPDCGTYDDGGTTVTIIFRTEVLENFIDDYPSGDSSVDQGDILDDSVTVDGSVLNTLTFASQGTTEADGSSASVTIARDILEKFIYAVNGNTVFSTPVHVKPGDTVTYQLTYSLPTSDVEDLSFADYLPLPVFHVDDPDEDGAPDTWTFDPTVSAGVPAAGVAKFGPSDSFYAYSGIVPAVSTNAANNRLTFTYGDYDDIRNQTTNVDLLFTVTVSDDPFADGLYLTNEAHAFEGSTNSGTADANAIVQIILDEPVLVSNKAVIWTDNPSAVFSPIPTGPVTFLSPGNTPRWSGTINSTNLATTPIDSDVTGVDAGDTVTFAIVIENQGHSGKGAFDITLTDTLPAQFQIPGGGLNLQIYYGDGTGPVGYTGLGGGGGGPDDDLFYNGIQLVDPDPNNGACQTHDLVSGRNIILITYDLELKSDVPPGTITNTSALTNYAGTEGGPNHLPEDQEDTATVTVVNAIDKTLVSTEIVNAVNENGEVVIGELVTYRVTLAIHEGETPNATLVDNVDGGLAFVDCSSVTRSSSALTTTYGNGDFRNADMCNDGLAAPFNPIISNSGQTITFDLGTITNSDTVNTTIETLMFEYSVVTLNLYANQAGTLLNNTAAFAWNGGPYSASGSVSDSAENVIVIEPAVTTTKIAAPSTTDAGNIVLFTITFTNTSAAEAFDLTWSDTVPADMTYQAGSLLMGVCPATITSVDDSTAPTLTATISDLNVGETCILTFSAQVNYSVTPGYVITNTAETRWTSLSGDIQDRSTYNTESDERTGEDGFPGPGVVDDYRGTDSATVTINNPVPVKSLVSTSEDHTGPVSGTQRVAIGEIVRYRLVVSIPEGTSPNFQVRDYLPTGLTFVNDGTAMLTFLSDEQPINSSDPVGDTLGLGLGNGPFGTDPWVSGTDPTGITPAFVLPDENVGSSNSLTADPDSFSSGTDIYFKLGTLLNNDSDADIEYVIIEFNALVDNTTTGSNDAGDNRTNYFIVYINGLQNGSQSNNVTVRIAEPLLTLTKTPAIDPSQDAGDTVTYTLTISAASGTGCSGSNGDCATAFDLSLSDTLDANLIPVSAVITSTTQTSPCVGNGGGTTAFVPNISLGGQNVTLTATCLDPGSNIVVTITATVINTVVVPSTIPNIAYLTWTSLPGDYGTTSNPTGSQVTGAPGTGTGERTGSGVAPNDYTTSSSGPVVLASPAVDKHDPSPIEYTIGQTVTYDIWVTLPEGVTQSLVVIDNIPSGTNTDGRTRGLKYVSYSVLTSDPSLAADYNGSLPAPAFSCAGTCSTGDDITLTFGDVTTAADNITNNNTFIIRVTLLVENVSGNQDIITPNADYPTTLTNQATITYTGGSSSNTAAAITVIEARITTTKSVNPTTSVQAGDTLTYTVRFTNTGHSTAYEVTARDDLAQGVLFGALVSCVDQSAAAVPTTVTDNTTWLEFDGNPAGSWDIAVGNWIECQYTADAQTSLYMDGGHTNTVDADWSSLEGSQPDERVYNDTTEYNFDGTQDTATATFNTDAPTLVKDDGGVTQVVIGDTITFTLTIGGDLGTYRDVVIADLLPAGLIYNNDAVISGFDSTPAPVVSSPNDGTAPVTITWTFGDVYKNLADATITYSARVADVVGNEIGDVLINDVTLDHDYANGTPATQLTDSEQSTITEPVIVTAKDIIAVNGNPVPPASISDIEAGDSITYRSRFTNTGTSTAYEVTADDILPANVDYNNDAACVYFDGSSTSPISVTVTGTTTLHFEVWDIPATTPDSYIECTYSITTQSDIALGTNHTNTVDADWSSQNGTQANERNYDDSVNRPGVDKQPDGADDDTATFSTDVPASIEKGSDVTQVAIGDVFHITITIISPLGSLTDTSLVDILPAGMVYVTGSQTVNGNINAPTFSVSSPNDGTVPVTLTWDFGNAVVTGNPVIVEYDARAANVISNVDGTNLVNNVTFYYTDGSGPHDMSDDNTVTVVESDLNVDKTHAAFAVQPDAGDEVHYIVTITPTASSHATAYDVHFTDILPGDVTLNIGSILVALNGDAVGADTSGSAGNTVDVVIDSIPNTSGTSVQIDYWATLNNSVTPSQLIQNTGSLTWTSTSGTNSNERTGTGGAPNDYNDSDTDSFNVHDPSFSKSVYPGSDSDFAIGETATFSLNVTLPEGTTPTLRIFDNLPPGLQYVTGSAVVDTTGFAGSVPAPTITLLPDPPASGTDVQFDFTTITVTADGNDANNTFSVRFQAVVLNEAGNQQSPPPLVNSATMTVSGTDYTDTESINIIEPILTIVKTADDIYPGANQVVTFTLTVQHDAASNSDAYDVLIYDDLPADLTLDLSSIAVILGGSAAGVTDNSSGNRVEILVASIPDDGSTVTVEFEATVASTVVLNQVIINTANVTWTSTSGTNDNERTGSGTGPNDYAASGSVTLTIQKSLSKSVVGHSHGATSLPEVAIGEILTYEVNFNVPVGTTTGVTITDILDLGLAYVDCVTISASAGISTTIGGGFVQICNTPAISSVGDPANPASDGRQVVFDFGDLDNTSGSVGLITLQYRVVVLDVIENQETTTGLNNSVDLDWSAGPLHTVSPTPVDVVESDLLLSKTADQDVALPGAAITFTLTIEHSGISTADAYDVILEDIVPDGLEYIPGSLVHVSGIAPTSLDDTLAPTLRVIWTDFPRIPGESVIQFQAWLENIPPGTSVTNDASVEWTSLPGDVSAPQSVFNVTSTERRYDPLSAVDVYGVTASANVTRPPLPATGFAPGVVTDLPPQTSQNRYASLGDLWLEIPALGVEIPIVGVPLEIDGWDLTWLGDQAGYLEGTAFPASVGNSGLTGHVYLANGQPGPFVNLHTMHWGQSVIVHFNGSRYIYKVQTVRRVWPDDLSALKHAEDPTLTLITCQGYNENDGSYRYRIAVQAVLVDIQPEFVSVEPDLSK
ncbi:MAG: sortase [Chloroflexota bacterium]